MDNKTHEQVAAAFKAAGEGLESATLKQVAGLVAAIRDKLNDCEAEILKVGDTVADPKLNPHGYTRMKAELVLGLALVDTLRRCRGVITECLPAIAMMGMLETNEMARKK